MIHALQVDEKLSLLAFGVCISVKPVCVLTKAYQILKGQKKKKKNGRRKRGVKKKERIEVFSPSLSD